MAQKWNVGFLEGILNPERLRVEEAQKKANIFSDYQKYLAMQELKEEGEDAGFRESGLPALEGIQNLYDARRRAQAPFGPLEKDKGTGEDKVRLGAKGFVGTTGRGGTNKDQIFNRIQEKKKHGPLSTLEQKFEKSYLGISDSKLGPEKPADRVRVWKHAKDMAKAVEGGDVNEDQINDYLLDAAQFLYPNIDIESTESLLTGVKAEGADSKLTPEAKAGIDRFKIKLPESIKTVPSAMKFLIDSGMDEEDAKQFLIDNFDIQPQ